MEGLEFGVTRPRQVRYACGNLRAEMGLLARPLVLSLGRILVANSPYHQRSRPALPGHRNQMPEAELGTICGNIGSSGADRRSDPRIVVLDATAQQIVELRSAPNSSRSRAETDIVSTWRYAYDSEQTPMDRRAGSLRRRGASPSAHFARARVSACCWLPAANWFAGKMRAGRSE